LIIDPDRILAGTITAQAFEPITRRVLQILDRIRRVEQSEFTPRSPLDFLGEPAAPMSNPDALGFFVSKPDDHSASV